MKYLRPISLVITWVIWLLFAVALVANITQALALPQESSKSEWQLTYTLILGISVIMTFVTFGLKWSFNWIFRRIKNPSKRTIWTYLLLPFFGIIIWLFSFPILTYGLFVFLTSHNFMYCLPFVFLSACILGFHAPIFMITKLQPEQDAAANP